MKKLLILFVLVLFTAITFAQKAFDNEVYFRFGYSLPSWNQFGYEKSSENSQIKRLGGMFELGTIFMMNGVFNSDKIVFGIDADYVSIYYYQFSDVKLESDYPDENIDVRTIKGGSKAGPSLTFVPAKNLAIDIYFKGTIDWFTATTFVFNDDLDDAEIYRSIITPGWSTGVNLRYSLLLVGFEFNSCSPKLENIDEKGTYLGNLKNDGDRSPLPSITFSIGMSF